MTERETVLRERAAFRAGIEFAAHERIGSGHLQPCQDCARGIVTRYPLPLVTRPRVVEIQGALYRVGENGRLQQQSAGAWVETYVRLDAERVKCFAALLENPTEIVEDGA